MPFFEANYVLTQNSKESLLGSYALFNHSSSSACLQGLELNIRVWYVPLSLFESGREDGEERTRTAFCNFRRQQLLSCCHCSLGFPQCSLTGLELVLIFSLDETFDGQFIPSWSVRFPDPREQAGWPKTANLFHLSPWWSSSVATSSKTSGLH